MIQVIPAPKTFGSELGRALGGGISQGYSQASEAAQKLKGEEAGAKRKFGYDVKLEEEKSRLKRQEEQAKIDARNELVEKIENSTKSPSKKFADELTKSPEEKEDFDLDQEFEEEDPFIKAKKYAAAVDGTGMCGGCRVQVGGRSQFACVDGPEFDAHEVDFTAWPNATPCTANPSARRWSGSSAIRNPTWHWSATDASSRMSRPAESVMPNPLPPKERTKIPRQKMPEQEPEHRRQNFTEVNLGLNFHLATQEAMRCLDCAHPKCIDGCPVGVKVKDFIALVLTGDYLAAAAKIREDNIMSRRSRAGSVRRKTSAKAR